MAITQEKYWISPGGNTPQSTNYTATGLPSRKLSNLDEPDTQDTAGEAETSSQVMYSYGPPHMAGQKHDDQLEHTYSSNVRVRDIALKTFLRRWTIGKSGERGSRISVLAARHDDDDDDVTLSGSYLKCKTSKLRLSYSTFHVKPKRRLKSKWLIAFCQSDDCVHLKLDQTKREHIMDILGARSVMVIVVENGHGDTSSNPGRG